MLRPPSPLGSAGSQHARPSCDTRIAITQAVSDAEEGIVTIGVDIGSAWLAFDQDAAVHYGKLASIVARTRSAHARTKDIMLAGHALSLGAKLVTLNPKDFSLVADEVEIVVPQRCS
ncbi:MAG TPA: hypothetical protein VN035_13140 [Microbacterium sp.]|nr:hypothetical protein [Microbacterium sp.]